MATQTVVTTPLGSQQTQAGPVPVRVSLVDKSTFSADGPFGRSIVSLLCRGAAAT